MSGARVAGIGISALVVAIGLALAAAGGGLLLTTSADDADGFLTAPSVRLATESHAIVGSEVNLHLDDVPRIGATTVRFAVEGEGSPVFMGVGPATEVAAYLDGVAHAELVDINGRDDITYRAVTGSGTPPAPATQDFWVATAVGETTRELTWDVDSGVWSVVLMNGDGSPGVIADVTAAVNVPLLVPLGIGLLAGGLILIALAAAVIVALASTAEPVAPRAVPTRYPVALEAELDEPLSRGLWLVKWLLAIPHLVVLAFLWLAFVLLTVVAGVAILFTGRYPRGIFDFNVGVMRWTWRVVYYATGVLGTDRYPPFSLQHDEGYPASFDVAYPERLSRPLVLVKSWLLLIPHLIVVAVLSGSGPAWTAADGSTQYGANGGGLIAILALIAGFVLLFRGRYPQGLFDLLMGLNRWVFRVGVYGALMRDEYPPFRLDMGGSEPDEVAVIPGDPDAGPSAEPADDPTFAQG